MIPAEIVKEISRRLPAKSVAQFRSVSKEWLSLLTEPAYQNTLKRNHLIFTGNRGRSLYSHPLNHHEPVLTPANRLIEFDAPTKFHGSCNGLVLISRTHDFDRLVVLNPTTKESVRLPPSGFYDKEPWRISHGIGYDSVTDDYKVISLTTFKDEKKFRFTNFASLYSLRDNIWKRLGDFPSVRDKRLGDFSYFVNGEHGVYLDGFLNWFFREGILNFSLAEERFSLIPLSDHFHLHITDYSGTRITVLGGKLAIYCNSTVLLMNEYGIKESWITLRLNLLWKTQ